MLEKMKSFKKIDAHSHVGYFGSWSDVGITPEEMIAQMDEYNVEKTIISTFPIDESIEAVDKYPDRLIGAAWVNPYDGEKALEQIRDAVNNHGFKAIKLNLSVRATHRTTSAFSLLLSWRESLTFRS